MYNKCPRCGLIQGQQFANGPGDPLGFYRSPSSSLCFSCVSKSPEQRAKEDQATAEGWGFLICLLFPCLWSYLSSDKNKHKTEYEPPKVVSHIPSKMTDLKKSKENQRSYFYEFLEVAIKECFRWPSDVPAQRNQESGLRRWVTPRQLFEILCFLCLSYVIVVSISEWISGVTITSKSSL